MDLAEKLDDLRQSFPECKTLAFADLSTGMILYASSADSLRQEELDCLCNRAVKLLTGDLAGIIGNTFPGPLRDGVFQALELEEEEIGIFLKSTINPDDGLCCICTPGIALNRFMDDARQSLAEFGQQT